MEGFVLNQENRVCGSNKCNSNQFKDDQGKCQDCSSGCSNCTSGSICDSCLPYYLLQEDKTCKENPSMPAPENSEATETPTTVGATVGSVVAVAGTTIALVMGFKG